MLRFAGLAGILALSTACVDRGCWSTTRGFGHEQCRQDTFGRDTGFSTYTPPGTTGTDTTTDTGTDADPWGTPGYGGEDLGVTWAPSGASFVVGDSGATTVTFGMAETAAGGAGWYGEDCLDGICHAFTPPQMDLAYVGTEAEVIGGQTTLFNDGRAYDSDRNDRLTYLLILSGGPHDGLCIAFGNDPTYYDGRGCELWP